MTGVHPAASEDRSLAFSIDEIPKLRKGTYFPEFLEPRGLDESMTAVIRKPAFRASQRDQWMIWSRPWA